MTVRPNVQISVSHATRARHGLALAFAFLAATTLTAQLQPAEMRELAAKAGFAGAVVRWCPADLQAGGRVFVVAVASPSGGGRYVVLAPDGTTTDLAAYAGDVDLSCYPRERADQLSEAMKASGSIDGGLSPRWNSTVVCGFLENTVAACWQFDAEGKRFVEVGRWRT